MRRRMSFATAAVGAALALPGVSAAQAPPARDSVTTVGPTQAGPDLELFGPELQNIEINASSGPSGENPTGLASWTDLGVLRSIGGRVTCLAVRGNTATLNTVGYFGIVTVQVLDDQPDTFSAARTGDIDLANPEDFTGRAPTDCSPLPPAASEAHPVVSGDIRIVDGQPPRPTTKRQCKNGGWKQFGFKNTGRCVSFVNRTRNR